MFEVRRKSILDPTQQGQHNLIELCAKGGTIQLWKLEFDWVLVTCMPI